MSICKFCNKEFPNKGMGAHVISCRVNPRFAEYHSARIEAYKKRTVDYSEFTVSCQRCNLDFKILEPVNKFPIKSKYFCSRFCANGNAGRRGKTYKKKDKITKCICCNSDIINSRAKFCSSKCRKQARTNCSRSYRYKCRFTFNIYDYPEEFDLSLIDSVGWYVPTNAINKISNLSGISKDHKFSLYDAEKLNVDPEIVSHPANCALVIHNKNISKNKRSDITLSELLIRIENWNKKYQK